MPKSAGPARPGPAAAAGTWMEPQLATLVRDRFSDPGWLYERKLDGERCLAYCDDRQVRLLSRNRLDVTSTYPEVARALRAAAAGSCVLDGEVVAFDGAATSFSRLQRRLGVRDPSGQLVSSVPVYYYIFDILLAGGDDVRDFPLRARKRLLRQFVRFGGPLRYTAHRNGDGEAYWAQACSRGWEGVVAKRADAPYRAGRSRDWLKFKCEHSQEFVIGGFTDPQGSRAGFGALLLGYYDGGTLAYAGKVGTGFDDSLLASLHARLLELEQLGPPFGRGTLPRSGVHWTRPQLVAQIGFSEWTGAGNLRHPRYQGLRRDKDAADVTRERAERAQLRPSDEPPDGPGRGG
jgi:bifunctional non-homologous end joining protein LigD